MIPNNFIVMTKNDTRTCFITMDLYNTAAISENTFSGLKPETKREELKNSNIIKLTNEIKI
jgi:hypothetical protein